MPITGVLVHLLMGWGLGGGFWNEENFLAPLKLYCKEKEIGKKKNRKGRNDSIAS